MTALTAIFSTVHSRHSGGMSPSDRAASAETVASIACTRSGVGGTMGSPSHHPRRTNSS